MGKINDGIPRKKDRKVTFGKRKIGLLKKAHEFEVLLGLPVMVMFKDTSSKNLNVYKENKKWNSIISEEAIKKFDNVYLNDKSCVKTQTKAKSIKNKTNFCFEMAFYIEILSRLLFSFLFPREFQCFSQACTPSLFLWEDPAIWLVSLLLH